LPQGRWAISGAPMQGSDYGPTAAQPDGMRIQSHDEL
jgi:hypothetical protein